MRIRSRLAATFVPLAVLALVVLAVTNYLQARNALVEQQVSHLRSVASIQARRVSAVVQQNLERLALVSSRTQLRLSLVSYMDTPRPEPVRKMTQILEDARASIPEFQAIHVLTLSGEVVASTEPEALHTHLSETEAFMRGVEGDVADLPILDINGDLGFVLSGPLVVAGERVGVVVVHTSGATILAAIADYAGLGKTGETVLARLTPDGDAEYIVPLRFDQTAALRRIAQRDSGAPIVRAVTQPGEFVLESLDYRGEAVLAVGRQVEGVRWGLLAKIDEREAFAAIDRMLVVVTGVLAAVIAGVVVVSLLVAGPIAKPIARLTATARVISRGESSQRVDVSGGGEVGELAATFDEMARRVTLRTEDLEQANGRLRREMEEHRDTAVALERSQDDLSGTVHELKQRNSELERFAFTVSHDLKSPIVTIKGFVGLLEQDINSGRSERVTDDLQRIGKAADHMRSMLDDVLALSRAGRVRKELTRCPVREIVDQAVLVLGAEVGRLSLTFDEDLGCIRCDRQRMVEAVQNLLGNAIKFSAYRDQPRVHVGVRHDGQRRVYYVRDNGCGVDKRHHEVIFELFERIDHQIAGTGIGLALVQRIIGAHDGRVWVESAGDQAGSAFCFSLPPEPKDPVPPPPQDST